MVHRVSGWLLAACGLAGCGSLPRPGHVGDDHKAAGVRAKYTALADESCRGNDPSCNVSVKIAYVSGVCQYELAGTIRVRTKDEQGNPFKGPLPMKWTLVPIGAAPGAKFELWSIRIPDDPAAKVFTHRVPALDGSSLSLLNTLVPKPDRTGYDYALMIVAKPDGQRTTIACVVDPVIHNLD